MDTVLFYILAFVVLMAGVSTVTRKNPVMSAISLVVCLLAVAGIFALLSAPFLAVLQVLIAAGAVMVLFLFVVMLVDTGEKGIRPREINFGKFLGVLAAAWLGIILVLAIARPPYINAPLSGDAYEAPVTLGELLFGRYVVPFELAGALLLTAAVAAVVLAKKR